MHESRVYYNLLEANALVPRLEHLFAELARIQRQVNALTKRAGDLGVRIDLESLGGETSAAHPVRREIEERLCALSREFIDCVAEVEGFGVVIDDLDLGIVNFYSWFEGQEIFLSWQFGEPEVGHWHSVTENSIARRTIRQFSSRRPAQISLH